MSNQLNLSIRDLRILAKGLGIKYKGMNKEQLYNSITKANDSSYYNRAVADQNNLKKNNTLTSSKIKIYTIEGCSYCIKAKNLLKEKGIYFEEIIVPSEPKNKEAMKKQISNEAGNRYSGTFPAIFQGNRFIGGYNDLQAEFNNSCVIL